MTRPPHDPERQKANALKVLDDLHHFFPQSVLDAHRGDIAALRAEIVGHADAHADEAMAQKAAALINKMTTAKAAEET